LLAKYIMALDQGTTGSRAIIFNHSGSIISTASKEFKQIYPKPGWVEHNPMEIWSSQIEVAKTALDKAGLKAVDIAAIGITNQRETTIVWDKKSGKPVYNAIVWQCRVWQCRRTAPICDQLKKKGLAEIIQKKTGLVVDAYFSGTKIKWILDNVSGVRERAEKKELLFGTVDSWLIWNLTKGKTHVTDYTNASRTMLFNIHNLDWDDWISPGRCSPEFCLQVIFMPIQIKRYLEQKFLFPVMPETSRPPFLARPVMNRVWPKTPMEPDALS